jgi:uncharacterized protein (TIGR03086 family)
MTEGEPAVADRVPLDFDPPVRALRALLLGITDEDLAGLTPCDDWTLGDLLAHISELTHAFTQAARKVTDDSTAARPGRPSATHLPAYWRSRLPVVLEDLAVAWRDPAAWTGTAKAAGLTMPATAMGAVAMTELVMHSWDVARATDQEYAVDPRIIDGIIETVSHGSREGIPELFGPPAEVDDEASLLEQAVALSGRDPAWRSATIH